MLVCLDRLPRICRCLDYVKDINGLVGEKKTPPNCCANQEIRCPQIGVTMKFDKGKMTRFGMAHTPDLIEI